MMVEILRDFHFLRPEWFYAFIPALILFLLIRFRLNSTSSWERTIDPALLPHLLVRPTGKVSRNPFSLLLLAWMLAIIALAGPVWEKTPQPVHEREDALIVVLDLTRSMNATDVKPSRLVRATRKLVDLLEARDEGVTGLVVFAGDAHTVSPLTDDTNTIIAMIPALRPEIMPASGSQLTPALKKSIQLFHDAGVSSGRILIVTDEIRDAAEAQSYARNFRFSFPVSVLAVGTAEGAPIPLPGPEGGYLKDARGNLVIPKTDTTSLGEFAQVAGGRFSTMTLAEEDLAYLLGDDPLLDNDEFRALERDFDVWFEEGPWLILLLIPLAALIFRRGWMWIFALIIIMPPHEAHASFWDDLWLTPDQQAMAVLKAGDPDEAASLFEHPGWKGSALYKGEAFGDAGNQFASLRDIDSQYNLGNALARQGKFEEAIEAYDQALSRDPDHEDAVFNKNLIEQLLSEQQQQQQPQDDGEDGEQQQQDQSDQQQSDSEDGENQQQSSEENDQQQAENDKSEEGEAKEQEDQEATDQQMAEEDAKLDAEEQQALQQWLRRVPDDPGGLLRRKFERQHEDNLRSGGITRTDSNADW